MTIDYHFGDAGDADAYGATIRAQAGSLEARAPGDRARCAGRRWLLGRPRHQQRCRLGVIAFDKEWRFHMEWR